MIQLYNDKISIKPSSAGWQLTQAIPTKPTNDNPAGGTREQTSYFFTLEQALIKAFDLGLAGAGSILDQIKQAKAEIVAAIVGDKTRPAETADLVATLEQDMCDLRCVDVSAAGDNHDIEWVVVGHWESEPKERVQGRGSTVAEALQSAFSEDGDYLP